MRFLMVFLFLLGLPMGEAKAEFHQMLSLSIGMVNISVTENQSTLESTEEDANEASGGESSSASVISGELVYEFLPYTDKTYFIKLIAPLMSSDGSGFFLAGLGANFYFSTMSSLFTFQDFGSQVKITPTFRYYIGVTTGAGFVVYNTETAQKSDLMFDLEFHGGAIYNFKQKWGMRGELAVSRGTGIATSAIGIKLFLGVNFFLEK